MPPSWSFCQKIRDLRKPSVYYLPTFRTLFGSSSVIVSGFFLFSVFGVVSPPFNPSIPSLNVSSNSTKSITYKYMNMKTISQIVGKYHLQVHENNKSNSGKISHTSTWTWQTISQIVGKYHLQVHEHENNKSNSGKTSPTSTWTWKQ